MDLKRCVNVAATCGAMVVAKCSNYPVVSFANQPFKGEQVATLNVHCGLGAGELAALHVGNADRREFLIIGHPIEQVSKSERLAALGELVGSPEAINLLSDVAHLDETILQASPGDKLVLASQDNRYFKFKMLKKTKSKKIKSPVRQKTVRHTDLVDYLCEGMDVHSLRYFQKLISLYVHPVVVMDELAATKKTCVLGSKSEQERHRAEAELRNVYTLFIKPQVAATLSGDSEKDERLFKVLNDVMNLVCSVLDRFKGHLRQFIVDDKGSFHCNYF
jgi:class 3 adenylate cyclase